MKIVQLLLTATLVHSALAVPVEVERNLAEMGFVQPVRLAGTEVERDFFFPLASRDFLAEDSSFRVVVEPSPLLDPSSVVTILVNERPVATQVVGEGAMPPIAVPIPTEVKADDPTSQVLKLTVRTALAPRDGNPASDEILRATAWVDVLPTTTFVCAVEPTDPDWLAASRLPTTLGPQITVRLPDGGESFAAGLALRAVTWAAYAQPFGRVSVASDLLKVTDEIVIDPRATEKPGIAVAAGPTGRIITLSAGDDEQADAVWRMLRDLGRSGLPGERLEASAAADDGRAAVSPTTLRGLDPRIGELNRGPGETERRFAFVPAKLSGSSGQLELALAGRVSDLTGVGPIVGAVFLNDRMVHSARLDPEARTFQWAVPFADRAPEGGERGARRDVSDGSNQALLLAARGDRLHLGGRGWRRRGLRAVEPDRSGAGIVRRWTV